MTRDEILSVVAILVCIATAVYVVGVSRKVPAAGRAVKDAADERREAVKLRLELAARLFDVTIVLVGAVWGLVLTEKLPLGTSAFRGWILLGCDNVLLGLSVFFHVEYRRRVCSLLWEGGEVLPDIYDATVNYAFQLQWTCLLASLASVVLTVLATVGRTAPGGG